jgi:diguanylate cyclase (GGDEF)-like protein
MAHKKESLTDEFNAFLQIDPEHLEIVQRYQELLLRNADNFASIFYDYLFRFPATAKMLEKYQQHGGDIESLTRKQIGHLFSLITDINDPNYQQRQQHIGEVHYQREIAPTWIMGAYRLYQQHLQTIVQQSTGIADADRTPLAESLNKLLFRDMGMMLEGYWHAATADIRHEKLKVDELQQQISNLMKNIPQMIWSIDVINNIPLYISPTVREISPICMELPIPCLAWTVQEDRPMVEAAWQEALTGKNIGVESRVHGPDDQIRWFRRTFHPFVNESGKVVRIDGIMEEITDAIQARNKLERMATTDALTGLANRALWYDRIHQSLAMVRRKVDKHVILMLLDLNHFKYVNDTLGHPVGDTILHQVAQRLKGILRDGDTLARLGGDEFAVLLPLEESRQHPAQTVAKKIHNSFNEPYKYAETEIYLGVAIGIASYPDDAQDADTLVRRADMAMYVSKRNDLPYQFYEAGVDEPPKQLQLISQMKQGLRKQEFELHFQPKINLANGHTAGAEALIRWSHPKHGTLMPDSFIPIAEKMGLINEVTDWVLASALQHSKRWRENGVHIPVAINVSARSFQDRNFFRNIQNALAIADASPDSLELEITENTLMSNIDYGAEVLRNLSKLGIAVAIDDFGTGYSSLSYLQRLPIDQLKIDRSFVQEMDNNDNDAAIVRSVIDLGHNLGIKVIAEGVERQDSMTILKNLGCDAAQGYHISRPMPATQFDSWLQERALFH